MPLYLATYIGSGTRDDPCRPRGADQPGWAAIDLRADGGATPDGGGLNACLLWLPVADPDPALALLGLARTEEVSPAVRTLLLSRLGLGSLAAPRLADLVGELLLAPPVNGWKPLRPTGKRYEAWLDGLWWSQPVVAGGVAVLATDDFNRADAADLGANWDVWPNGNGLDVNGNAARAQTSTSAESYNAVAWPNDQYSQVKLTLIPPTADRGIGGACRMSTTASTIYYSQANTSASARRKIAKVIDFTFTNLGTDETLPVEGDVDRLEVEGTTLRLKVGGVQKIVVTDSAISAGRAGIWGGWDGNPVKLDDWEGGDLAVLARADYSAFPKPNIREAVLRGET